MPDLIIKLLIPLGVLLSALIASYSVMTNIENTQFIEKEKIKKELINEINYLLLKVTLIKEDVESYFEHIRRNENKDERGYFSPSSRVEIIDKLKNFENILNNTPKNVLSNTDIFNYIKEINDVIIRIRHTEEWLINPPKGVRIYVGLENILIENLKLLETRLQELKETVIGKIKNKKT
ncbi:MAG: hypothetical protein JXK05_09965 [Campylobacterales bacterium]|nr:hypothetical protein [Campylobacterales bacterium]